LQEQPWFVVRAAHKKIPAAHSAGILVWLPFQLRLFDTAKLSNGDAENLKVIDW